MSENPVRIILSDNREFHVGQKVEWEYIRGWRKVWIGLVSTSDEIITVGMVINNPSNVRAISPKVKRPMTAKEVWSLLQTGVEWRSDKWLNKSFAIGSSVIMHENEILLTNQGFSYKIESCTYRTAPDQPWQKFEVEE